jgi:hypothetical protein
MIKTLPGQIVQLYRRLPAGLKTDTVYSLVYFLCICYFLIKTTL